MAVAKFDGIEIPLIYRADIEHELVGDTGRTVSGKMRRDVVAVKRVWRLQTRPLTPTQANALIDHLRANLFTVGAFWYDALGAETNTVQAYVEIEQDSRVQFLRDGVWYSDGRQLTLRVTEQ